MRKSRGYRRELMNYERALIMRLYENPPRIGGFLSKRQRLRLLGKKRKERETDESDFWYSIRKSADGALLDLELLCRIAHDNQLREIFRPLDRNEERSLNLVMGTS